MSSSSGRSNQAIRSHRSLIGLLTANAISLTGTQITMIALPWYVLTTTGSAVTTGLVSFAGMTPYLLLRLLGGPVIDRVGARRVSVISDLISVVFSGLIPLLYVLHALPLPVLLVLAASAGAARGPGDAAKSAMVPEVAESSGVSLERLSGLSGTVNRLAASIGPAIAGGIVAGSGALPAVALDAISFALAAGIIAATVVNRRHEEVAAESETYFIRLRAGFSFLRRERLLLSLTLMVTVTNLLDSGVMTILVPVWARDHGGPAVIGGLTTAVSITAMAGSIAASAIAERLPRRATYFICFIIGGAPRITLLAFGVPVWVVIASWAASGLALGFVNPILSAEMYERIPAPMMGRVSALTGALALAGTPLGGPIAGALAGVGLGMAALTFAGAYFIATILPVLGPEWTRRGSPRPETAPTDQELSPKAV
jgi:MFS family permease